MLENMAILTGRRRQSEEAVIQLNRLSKHQKQSKIFYMRRPLFYMRRPLAVHDIEW